MILVFVYAPFLLLLVWGQVKWSEHEKPIIESFKVSTFSMDG